MNNLEIRPASPNDLEAVVGLLAAAELPVADLDEQALQDFLVASVGELLCGFIGLEHLEDIGLLRSLVVDPRFQGAGLGRVLVAALESHARDLGVRELWLLTIDADRWFSKLDYVLRSREDAPDPIRQTTEFSSLCPDDAVLMSKEI